MFPYVSERALRLAKKPGVATLMRPAVDGMEIGDFPGVNAVV